ncbi:hemolysin family protein [uncultured Bartonella sp.]|uniref:hemolysin family protein n=1 Tax=uncultured Bartonella sp. TaxID=104108 RepID=UPI002614B5E6|nr:hemolysin family protein [uncultured Bartonella sp.]
MTNKIDNSNQEASSPSSSGQNLSRGQNSEKRSLFSNLFSFMRARNNSTLREDLTDALSEGEGEASALFSPEERIMLNNILRLRETRVEDVMIPRSEIEALDITTTLAETLIEFEKSGHSRMPVYAESLDDPRGMLHIRDVLNYITREAQRSEKVGELDFSKIDLSRTVGDLNLIRTVLFVPGSMLAGQLLTRMQATRTQMALIIDEYGGTDGLASMEDIVELVVGDIEDEHDDVDMSIIREADNKWLVDASADLEEVEKALGSDFKVGEHGDDVDTIGGLIVSTLDRIPAKGELVEAVPGYQFRILEADKRRIKRIRIQPSSQRQKHDGEITTAGES